MASISGDILSAIQAFAATATTVIAFLALRNWQQQDKAKREVEFLDALIEAAHTYIAEMRNPITIMETAKIGMQSHALTWQDGVAAEIAVKGAIAFIQKDGERVGKRLLELLATTQPSVIRLRSLSAKGQVFCFVNYTKCLKAVMTLTWHFDRMEAFAVMIGSPTWNWDNPDVLRRLKDIMAIEPDEIRQSVGDNNACLIKFGGETYKRIYG